MSSDQTDLLGRRRRPRGGGVFQVEAAHSEVVDARLFRKEDRLAHVDLDVLGVGIGPLELRPDRGVLVVHLAEPVGSAVRGFEHIIQFGCLKQPVTVQIDGAGMMLPALGVEPVPVDEVAVRIELAKETVRQRHLPYLVLHLDPVGDDFRSCDGDLFTLRGLINNALLVGVSPARRVDAFAVNPCMHGDHVSRLRPLRGGRNRLEGL